MGRLAYINLLIHETWWEAQTKAHAYIDIHVRRALEATAHKKAK
jgi:hypothetical protein